MHEKEKDYLIDMARRGHSIDDDFEQRTISTPGSLCDHPPVCSDTSVLMNMSLPLQENPVVDHQSTPAKRTRSMFSTHQCSPS